MIFGFNTDIKVENLVFHVQTEDRGKVNPTIDTTIYYGGRVIAKRATSYKEYFESPEFDAGELKRRVEAQHKKWVAIVRGHEMEEMKEFFQPKAAPVEGLKIKLLNPSSIFHPTHINVQATVSRLPDGSAADDATVLVRFIADGAAALEMKGQCDEAGKVVVNLPLPKIGPNGADLQIVAQWGAASGELKYSLRPRTSAK